MVASPDLSEADPGEGNIVFDRRVGDRLKNLLVHVAHMRGLLSKLQADAQVRRALLVQAQFRLLKEALPRLPAHQLHQHVQRLRTEVHGGGVGEVLVDVLEGAGRPEEVVDGGVEALLRASVLPCSNLGVETSNVEEDGGFFKGNRSLAAWYSCQ